MILDASVPEAKPEIPLIEEGADHVYVIPDGTMFPDPSVGETVNNELLHTVVVCAVTTTGVGLTVTTTVSVLVQLFTSVPVTV